MRVGFGQVDITPKDKVNLCGFVARCNQSFEAIDDSLSVGAMVVEQGESAVLVLSFDLLGLSEDVTERIHQSLEDIDGFNIPRGNRIYCCSHTHSAPALIKLIGCGVIDPGYVEYVITAAKQAAAEAYKNLKAALIRTANISIPGSNYNRRQVLDDGRVVMTQNPDAKISSVGSVWDDFLFFRFEDENAKPVAGFVNWAAHACTVCGKNVSGDHPAELRRRLSKRFKMPFIYLQGACGDLNPPFREMTRSEMLRNVSSIMKSVTDITWSEPVETLPFAADSKVLILNYRPVPQLSELKKVHDGMKLIAETGNGPQQQMSELANILNIEPGQTPDPKLIRHIAAALQQWSRELIDQTGDGKVSSCDLSIKAWRIGNIVFCFVAAEVFVDTAIAIRQAFLDLTIVFIGYSSPLVGYLPTDQALDEGGYEVDYAHRFYGRPAAFAKGSESSAVAVIKELIESLCQKGDR